MWDTEIEQQVAEEEEKKRGTWEEDIIPKKEVTTLNVSSHIL
jgi:hypothetical protein